MEKGRNKEKCENCFGFSQIIATFAPFTNLF